VDYAQLVKVYGPTSESAKGRYSPAECTGIKKTPIEGKPDPTHISASFSERQNLNIRMGNRRMTPHERLLKECREPCTHDGDLFHAQQFRENSSALECHARHGVRRD
jgi:hypothetical protein